VPLGGKAIQVTGLRELARDLKKIDADLPKAMRKAGLVGAKIVADEAQRRAMAGTPVQRKAARAIKPRAGAARAAVAVTKGGVYPFAFGAFFGSDKYRQFDPWVGRSWQAGGPGGPYALNPAVAAKRDEVVKVYAESVGDLLKQTFPT